MGRAKTTRGRGASSGDALTGREAVQAEPQVAAFAIAAPGLEPVVAAELARLGVEGSVQAGGVAWTGTMESVARANLWLRAASRVIVRVAEFRARTFWELERHARKLPWERFVAAGTAIRLRVTSRKSRLYHTEAVAQRLLAAADRGGAGPADPGPGAALSGGTEEEEEGYEDDRGPEQLFVVRVVRDVCTVSADTSGLLLHRRGYRQAVAKAPLRETIAAAMLLRSEWPTIVPLVDPMCGSGTIPIEAALLARRIAPGLGRTFAFQRWPGFDASVWARLVTDAKAKELPGAPAPILGSDRDAGAIDASRANAGRAGVGGDIDFRVQPLSAVASPERKGWLVTNPPYGVRVGEGSQVRDLYASLGNVVRERFRGWTVALLSPGEALDGQVGIPFRERFATVNGGIAVRLVSGEVAQ